ncbi:MAG: hypothetical protein U0074_01120 [Kouleothrix sp.]
MPLRSIQRIFLRQAQATNQDQRTVALFDLDELITGLRAQSKMMSAPAR